MKKRQIRALLCLFSIMVFSITVFARTNCECGEHDTGITIYSVQGENSDCCDDLAHDDALIVTYTQQTNGVW